MFRRQLIIYEYYDQNSERTSQICVVMATLFSKLKLVFSIPFSASWFVFKNFLIVLVGVVVKIDLIFSYSWGLEKLFIYLIFMFSTALRGPVCRQKEHRLEIISFTTPVRNIFWTGTYLQTAGSTTMLRNQGFECSALHLSSQ